MDRPPGGGARGRTRRRRLDPGAARRRGRRAQLPPHDIAVMYRTNAQSRPIEEAFLRYGLRYQLVGGVRFYQRREVKDALAYLRMLRADHDVAAFERIINVPARGIGERTIEAVRELAAAREGNVWEAIRWRPLVRVALAARTQNALCRLRRIDPAGCERGSDAGAAGAAGPGARGIGLPADAAGRLAGGRGPLGQPARAARGGRALRATWSPRTRSTACSRRPPWWPTRTPTRRTPTRSR